MSSGQEFILTVAMEKSGEKDEHNSTIEVKLQNIMADLFDLVLIIFQNQGLLLFFSSSSVIQSRSNTRT